MGNWSISVMLMMPRSLGYVQPHKPRHIIHASECPSPCQLSFAKRSGSKVMIANRLRPIAYSWNKTGTVATGGSQFSSAKGSECDGIAIFSFLQNSITVYQFNQVALNSSSIWEAIHHQNPKVRQVTPDALAQR